MAFNETEVVRLVREFYRGHGMDNGVIFHVAPTLAKAFSMANRHGNDARWGDIPTWKKAAETQKRALNSSGSIEQERSLAVWNHVIGVRGRRRTRSWHSTQSVSFARFLARYDTAIPGAVESGLGWLFPARGVAVIVPLPTIRTAEGLPHVLHEDGGHPAILWPSGRGHYILHGTEFTEELYFEVIGHRLLIQDVANLPDADQRSIALQYLTFEQLVLDSNADLLDTGVRGTRLFRLPLPSRIASDRGGDYGDYDYFIHMRDASHPEREFIEWVDPTVGVQRDAELCQAHAFGITLKQWLSISQEG